MLGLDQSDFPVGNSFAPTTAALSDIALFGAAPYPWFQISKLPDILWKKGARLYMAGLMRVYHLRADDVSGLGEKAWELKEIWLSRAALLNRYGPSNP